MWGTISASTKSRAVCRTRRFSSVRLKSIGTARILGGRRPYTPPMKTAVGTRPVDPATHQSGQPGRGDERPAGPPADYQALAQPHLSPILGRYFNRSWSHGEGHELVDTAGNRYL